MKAWTLLVVLCAVPAHARDDLPVIKSNNPRVSIRDGENLKRNGWVLAPEARPDVYEVDLLDGKPHPVTFITDIDSISFVVHEGHAYDFIVQWDGKQCYTQIIGRRLVPAAVFDEEYQSKHSGRTFIEVPEPYELVNVAIALTTLGTRDENFIYQHSAYYTRVRRWFDPYRHHAFVAAIDSLLTRSEGYYASLKMNANAFEFDAAGRIVQSRVYDRTGFRNERTNRLRPYLAQMQSFADDSRFREFYEENAATYAQQVAFFRDTVDVAEMKRWLEQNFPGSDDYDSYRIIFSPLVSYNQSTTWFESNGFKELQPHVNFPYPRDANRNGTLSARAEIIYRGNIVFTELNHGYINPEANKYAAQIREAISHRDAWVDSSRGANYYRGNATFNEYMNWGLVELRILDYVPEAEQEELVARVERMMVKNRGFLQFPAFNRFLMDLYRGRTPGTTLADLYPRIIDWFGAHN